MPDFDRAIAGVAVRQRHLITYPQLRGIGLSEGTIARRVADGRLIPVLHRVYLVAIPELEQDALTLAALLSSRANTLLVDDSAAEFVGLLPASTGLVTLGSPTARRTTRRETAIVMPHGDVGRVHTRRATVPDTDVLTRGLVRSTSLERTLLDLARFPDDRFEEAWREGMYRDRIKQTRIQALLDRGGRIDGAVRLNEKFRAEFFPDLGAHGVDSPAEYAAIRMVVAAGLPEPLVNHWIKAPSKWRRLDLYFAAVSLAVEIDGWQGHRSRDSFEDDPYRDTELANIGIYTMRFTARRISREAAWAAESILTRIRERQAMLAALDARPTTR